MATPKSESTVQPLVCHANERFSLIQAVVKRIKSFTDSDDYQINFQASEAWLSEHGFVHAGGSDYVKYDSNDW